MMAEISNHAFGSKANIETAKTEGIIDAYDVLFLDTKEIGHFLDRLVRQFCGLTTFEHGNGRLLTTKETGKGGLVQPLRLARLLEQETDFCREIRHGG